MNNVQHALRTGRCPSEAPSSEASQNAVPTPQHTCRHKVYGRDAITGGKVEAWDHIYEMKFVLFAFVQVLHRPYESLLTLVRVIAG